MSENLSAVREVSGKKSSRRKPFTVNFTFGAMRVHSSSILVYVVHFCIESHYYTVVNSVIVNVLVE